MIVFSVRSKDTKIRGTDYIFDKTEKLDKLVPYLKPKLFGEWYIVLIEPPMPYIRDIMRRTYIPEYVKLEIFVEKSSASQIASEYPNMCVQEKTPYEKFSETLKDEKLLLIPAAAKELYYRVGRNKDKLPDYIRQLKALSAVQEITLNTVKQVVIDERVTYASEVLLEFITMGRSRWKKFGALTLALGDKYAYYALRKQSEKLLEDKQAYLTNKKTKIWNIQDIDALSINLVYTIFHSVQPIELISCMRMIEDRKKAREILYDIRK